MNRFPDDEVVGLRGNVPTRLKKVDSNDWHGAVFAAAGLERLGLDDRITEVLDWMIPAPSQGIVGIVCKEGSASESVLKKIDHKDSHLCGSIERAFLNELEAGCSSPVGAHAHIAQHHLNFSGAVLSLDGSERLNIERSVPLSEAKAELGREWALILKEEGATELLEHPENE
jgi:hydroxymethylbilane synthase